MQRQLARLPELALTDNEQAVIGIEVAAVKRDGFAHPHASKRIDKPTLRLVWVLANLFVSWIAYIAFLLTYPINTKS